jgi:hypothetical protein
MSLSVSPSSQTDPLLLLLILDLLDLSCLSNCRHLPLHSHRMCRGPRLYPPSGLHFHPPPQRHLSQLAHRSCHPVPQPILQSLAQSLANITSGTAAVTASPCGQRMVLPCYTTRSRSNPDIHFTITVSIVHNIASRTRSNIASDCRG